MSFSPWWEFKLQTKNGLESYFFSLLEVSRSQRCHSEDIGLTTEAPLLWKVTPRFVLGITVLLFVLAENYLIERFQTTPEWSTLFLRPAIRISGRFVYSQSKKINKDILITKRCYFLVYFCPTVTFPLSPSPSLHRGWLKRRYCWPASLYHVSITLSLHCPSAIVSCDFFWHVSSCLTGYALSINVRHLLRFVLAKLK